MVKCKACGRPLAAKRALLLGYGRICAKKAGAVLSPDELRLLAQGNRALFPAAEAAP